MGIDTHKTEIVPLVLEKHPDADSLSIVRIYNFVVVARTEDWQGVDRAAYVQPDSVLPDKPEYAFLKDTSSCKKEREIIAAEFAAGKLTEDQRIERLNALAEKINKNTKYLRVAAKKLRGVWSMGMLLPAPEGAQIGDDVSELLGITHYEPPIVESGDPKVPGYDVAPAPPVVYAPKYDMESVYKYARMFEPGEMVYVTEKIDGQNARFVATRGTALDIETIPEPMTREVIIQHAGSRTEWKKPEGESNWWRVQKQNPWIPEWCAANVDSLLYGETFGWVAPLRYGTQPGTLLVPCVRYPQGHGMDGR
jgi:hypothetical protein